MDHFEFVTGSGQPIGEEVRSPLLEPFVAATRAALVEMAGTEAVLRAAVRTALFQGVGEVSVVVRLSSAVVAYLVLAFPQRTAAALAERVLAEAQQEIDYDLIGDCVGEIANVVAGQAKALLAGTPYHFSFSVPQVVTGGALELVPHPGRHCLAVVFDTDLGEIAMQLL